VNYNPLLTRQLTGRVIVHQLTEPKRSMLLSMAVKIQ
jgi:hypothetical protein